MPLRTSDKQIAETRLNKIILDEQREREGLISPKRERDAAQKPLLAHVEDFIETKRAVGRDERYVVDLYNKLVTLCTANSWEHAKDVTAESFEKWRAQQRKAAKTLNEYFTAIRSLLKWLEPHLGANPLRFVEKVQTGGTQKRERRAFTMAELRRLVADSGSRGVVYFTAAYTGLRRGELLQLEWGDVHLDAPQPFVNVRASISKNHKQAMQPLDKELVRALRKFRPVDAEPSALVFRSIFPRMTVFRKDLINAQIPYVDAKGEYADFHALRKTYCTQLTLADVPQRVIMELMRHSSMHLTARTYTDAGMLPTHSSVAKLPSLMGASDAAPQIAPQKLVQASPPLSAFVHETESAHCAGNGSGKGLAGKLGANVRECPATSESEIWCAVQGSKWRCFSDFQQVTRDE